MESLEWYGYIVWLPLVFWVGLFFWFWRYSGTLYLKKMIKKGKKWAVIPEAFSKNPSSFTRLRLKNFLLSLLVSALSALSVAWCLSAFAGIDSALVLLAVVPFLLVAVFIYKVAMAKVSATYQAAYFLEYCRARYESDKKGALRNEADIHNRAIWSFAKKLKNAEAHKRLWKYVNAMANTKKIPPDVMAETMYG